MATEQAKGTNHGAPSTTHTQEPTMNPTPGNTCIHDADPQHCPDCNTNQR